MATENLADNQSKHIQPFLYTQLWLYSIAKPLIKRSQDFYLKRLQYFLYASFLIVLNPNEIKYILKFR